MNKELLTAVNFAFGHTKKLASSSPNEVTAEVTQGLTDLFRHAGKLRFWHERLGEVGETPTPESLAGKVPILTRAHLQDSAGLLRLRIPGTSKREYYTSRTSGSTGKPVEVMKFTTSQRIQSAVTTLLRREWADLDVTKNYARIRSGRDETTSDSWGFPYTLLGKTGSSYSFDIKSRGGRGVVEALIEHEISYVHGNMTILRALALAVRDSGLIDELKLELALTWAEKVTKEDRDLIREVLGIEIWDSYSSEELGLIASQCPHATHLHVFPFLTLVEIIDEDGNPCEIGQVGRVVATSLHNFAQPMIRYELGDLASFQEPCEHFPALPVISPEVARIRDAYYTRDGIELFPRFGKARFLEYRGLWDYQVVVFSDRIAFFYSASSALNSGQEIEIREDVGKEFDFDLDVEVVRLEQGQLASHWKRRVFYRVDAPFTNEAGQSLGSLI